MNCLLVFTLSPIGYDYKTLRAFERFNQFSMVDYSIAGFIQFKLHCFDFNCPTDEQLNKAFKQFGRIITVERFKVSN